MLVGSFQCYVFHLTNHIPKFESGMRDEKTHQRLGFLFFDPPENNTHFPCTTFKSSIAMWGVLIIHLKLKLYMQHSNKNQSQEYGDETIRKGGKLALGV